jgi:regulator of replication initiation timing
VKTAKYQKRCFDQIEGITEDNKLLTAELERLRKRLETAEKD